MLLERLSPFGGLAPAARAARRRRPAGAAALAAQPAPGRTGAAHGVRPMGYPWLVDAAGLSTRPPLAVSGLVTDAGVHNRPHLCGLLAVLAPARRRPGQRRRSSAGSARPGVHRTGLGKTVWISFPTA
jgi:hypothetical protein